MSEVAGMGMASKIHQTAHNTVMLPVGYTKDAVLRRADRLAAREVTFWETWGRESE